jgi:hypothetical protein|tara:strand:+ start:759 stop:950 length:192 start_codon:yes stop_codon:yes gene_type:complete
MKFSNQAVGALLLTLQKCLSEQADITDLLKDWDLETDESGDLVVLNPPTFQVPQSEAPVFETE